MTHVMGRTVIYWTQFFWGDSAPHEIVARIAIRFGLMERGK